MNLQTLINKLEPLNTKEKVDTLIQQMSERSILMSQNNDTAIRCAIQKMSVQKYFADKYGYKGIRVIEENKVDTSRDVASPSQTKKSKKKSKSSSTVVPSKETTRKKSKQPSSQGKAPSGRHIPSVLRAFSPRYKDLDKGLKNATKEDQERHRGLIRPTSTENSVSYISIPMGGLNKR